MRAGAFICLRKRATECMAPDATSFLPLPSIAASIIPYRADQEGDPHQKAVTPIFSRSNAVATFMAKTYLTGQLKEFFGYDQSFYIGSSPCTHTS